MLEALKSDPLTSATPVIVITAYGDRSEAMARGAAAHFTKPADRHALIEALNVAVAHGEAASMRLEV